MAVVAKTMESESVYMLSLWMKNGEKTSYLIEDEPRFSLVDGMIQFETNKVAFTIDAEDFDRFTFEEADEVTTAVTLPERESAELRLLNGQVAISQMRPGSEVSVYDASSRLIKIVKADDKGFVVIPTGRYPKGLYILKTETITYKMLKK